MMTEEEAKKSFCPFMRDIVPIEVQGPQIGQKIPVGIVPANRYPDGRGTCCIGSFCMMWRNVQSTKFKDNLSGKITDRDLSGNGEWIKEGYCGLGGKP